MRGCVLNLLQSIQRETGWATEYRMQQLLEEWGLPNGQD
jgi:NADH:ubiquinone oxidoreductase subunit E